MNTHKVLHVHTNLRAGSDPAQCGFTDERCIALTLHGDPIFDSNNNYLYESCTKPTGNAGFKCVYAGTKAGYRNEVNFICSKC
jgi:hypothetical protein